MRIFGSMSHIGSPFLSRVSMNAGMTPSEGRFHGKTFVFPIRVYYEDTDFSGVVYHASYLRFMERGRSEFLRVAGIGHSGLFAGQQPLVWAVRRMSIDFVRSARVEEALLVHTSIRAVAGARMHLEQGVMRDGEKLVNALVEVCVMTLDGRPRRVPDAIRGILESYLQSQNLR
jgi:acyl-CoA thioester hydrolase